MADPNLTPDSTPKTRKTETTYRVRQKVDGHFHHIASGLKFIGAGAELDVPEAHMDAIMAEKVVRVREGKSVGEDSRFEVVTPKASFAATMDAFRQGDQPPAAARTRAPRGARVTEPAPTDESTAPTDESPAR